MNDPLILLVEDNEPHVELIRLAFEGWPGRARLVVARSLAEARAQLAEATPDLIIADLNLPDGRGTGLLPSGPAEPAHPIVIMTAHRDERLVVEAMRAGALDCVVKSRETLRDIPHIAERVLREWRDVGGRRRAEAALRESEALARATLEHVLDGVITMDERRLIQSVNPSVERMFGYGADQIVGRPFEALPIETGTGERGPPVQPVHGSAAAGAGAPTGITWELTGRHRDGFSFPLQVGFSEIRLDRRRLFIATLRDLTRSKSAGEHLTHLAGHDQLTGLPNRLLFDDRLGHALQRARRHRARVAVILVDLDGFRMVNDTLGHRAGDGLLRQVAGRLRAALRGSDTLARLAGDEFAVILEEIGDVQDAAVVARKVIKALSRPYSLAGDGEAFVTASAGIAIFPDGAGDAIALMRNADGAMHQAKAGGGNTYRFFTPAMNASILERQELETGLRQAVERGELRLFYQPIVDLLSGRVTAVEALLRWQHPRLGLVLPDRFIRIAEETGLIVPIGRWVLDAACRQGAAWQREGLPPVRVSVNLSSRQCWQQHADVLLESCTWNSQRASPAPLTLELTESLLMVDTEFLIDLLKKLKDMGIKLSIDDFGTGYSSLSYLPRLPVDHIKIDRSFVRNMDGNPSQAALTSAIIAMARSLNLDVIAEGVETREQAERLRAMGCTAVQGFLYGHPMPAEAVERVLS